MIKLKTAYLLSMIMFSYCIKIKFYSYPLTPQKYAFNGGPQNQKSLNSPRTETPSSSSNPSSNLFKSQLNYSDIMSQLSTGIISKAELENEKNVNLLVNQYKPRSNKEKSDEIELSTSEDEITYTNKNNTIEESNSNDHLIEEDSNGALNNNFLDKINPISFTNNKIIPSVIEKEPIRNNITILNHTLDE